jgi:hypothetical protein
MKKPGQTPEARQPVLDASAARQLKSLLDSIQQTLLRDAVKLSRGDSITEDDLYNAARPLLSPDSEAAEFGGRLQKNLRRVKAKSVIEKSIRRNRPYELMALVCSVLLFLLGLLLILWAVLFSEQSLEVVARLVGGVVCGGLLLVPFRYAVEIHRHNVALDLLGHVLDQCDDESSLAAALQALLGFVFPARPNGSGLPEPPGTTP